MAGANKPRTEWLLLAAVAGALLGLLGAWAIYEALNPVLERRDDWLRELQGLLFNIIPLGIGLGAALGWLLASRWLRRD